MHKHKLAFLLVAASVLISTSALAQPRPDKNWKSWFGHVDGSFTLPQGDAGDILDDGWSLSGGATYWPESWPIGLVMEIEYSDFDFSGDAIQAINDEIADTGQDGRIDSGDFTSWSFKLNGTWSPSSNGSGFYVIGGIGVYNVEGRLKENGLVYYPPVCSPWYWWCVPGGVGPGSIIRGSQSSTEFGYNVGLGWAFEVGTGSQVYLEARYEVIDTKPVRTELFPITVGYRW